jgi:hypothetical protein
MRTVRDEFLGRFNTALRPEIVQYAKRLTTLSKQENTVLIFVARKAACFADCLSSLNLTYFNCPVTSETFCESIRDKRTAREEFSVTIR